MNLSKTFVSSALVYSVACGAQLFLTSAATATESAGPASAQAPGQVSGQVSGQTAAVSTAKAPAVTPLTPAPSAPATFDEAYKELHETLRRMSSSVGDILHEVTRTEEVYNNGTPVTNANSGITNSPMYQIYGGQTLQDAATHAVYLPARPHWLKNSLEQLNQLETKLAVDAADMKKLLGDSSAKSCDRAQAMVMSDIVAELGRDLVTLKSDISAQSLSNAKINVDAHKVGDTVSGLEKVAHRVWSEAPGALKKN